MQVLDVARLMEMLNYEPDTGAFTWIKSNSNRSPVGSIAGSVTNHGYLSIRIDGRPYLAHRLAWMYMHGEFPEMQLDHLNRDRLDNRLANLRKASQSDNMQNKSVNSNNTSGFTGVSFSRQFGKWCAYIMVNRKKQHLGLFPSITDACNAYAEAKAKVHTFNPEVVA